MGLGHTSYILDLWEYRGGIHQRALFLSKAGSHKLDIFRIGMLATNLSFTVGLDRTCETPDFRTRHGSQCECRHRKIREPLARLTPQARIDYALRYVEKKNIYID